MENRIFRPAWLDLLIYNKGNIPWLRNAVAPPNLLGVWLQVADLGDYFLAELEQGSPKRSSCFVSEEFFAFLISFSMHFCGITPSFCGICTLSYVLSRCSDFPLLFSTFSLSGCTSGFPDCFTAYLILGTWYNLLLFLVAHDFPWGFRFCSRLILLPL